MALRRTNVQHHTADSLDHNACHNGDAVTDADWHGTKAGRAVLDRDTLDHHRLLGAPGGTVLTAICRVSSKRFERERPILG